jgi:DNA recombination protein RmuC|tara:strand:- start:997 stop:2091 length:1095 start_codon:yes stop_codon:yes gene_type:complete
MELTGIILFVIGFVLGGITIWSIRQREIDSVRKNQDQLRDVFGDLSNEALVQSQKKFLELAEDKFSSILGKSDDQLSKKKELIDTTLKDMKNDLKNLSENTVALKTQMEESRKNMGELTDTTSQLRQILSSSQARGRWGERMVEDILKFIGLTEGINYEQQTQAGSDRPDFTFFLPDDKSLNMDVKFPLDHYEKYLAAENDNEKEAEKKYFLKDVRNRINEVSKRSYIDPEGGTVDYVLLFIPNESIYSFLNQEDGELIDFSLQKKIILCSPITLYAVLSLIRQAVSNFAMEKKAGEMQELVGVFKKQWDLFTGKIESIGKSLGALSNHYEDLKGPRLRELEKPMDKISELQLGQDKTKVREVD